MIYDPDSLAWNNARPIIEQALMASEPSADQLASAMVERKAQFEEWWLSSQRAPDRERWCNYLREVPREARNLEQHDELIWKATKPVIRLALECAGLSGDALEYRMFQKEMFFFSNRRLGRKVEARRQEDRTALEAIRRVSPAGYQRALDWLARDIR